jgi:hypothetical protein
LLITKKLVAKTLELMSIKKQELAKQICQYNGQRGTEKQVSKCLKGFENNLELMQQFAEGRIK